MADTTVPAGNALDILTLARRVVELAEDRQASDILLLDLRELTTLADYFVICSAESERQLRALLEAIDVGVHRSFGLHARTEGSPESGWIVLDYNDVVIHIFSASQREYYRLERVWSKAQVITAIQ